MSNVSDVFDCSVDCVHLEKHKYLLMVYVLSPSEHMDSDGQVNCGNDVHDRHLEIHRVHVVILDIDVTLNVARDF